MTISNQFTSLSMIRFIVLIFLGVAVAIGQTTRGATDAEVADDLRTVIILAGYQCKAIVRFSQPSASDYHVSCDADRHYRVHISEENEVFVESRSHPSSAVSTADARHEGIIKKHLLAIVNLAGHECAGVLGYERAGRHDNLVTCEDQSTYRIHVTAEGRVAVDKLPIEK